MVFFGPSVRGSGIRNADQCGERLETHARTQVSKATRAMTEKSFMLMVPCRPRRYFEMSSTCIHPELQAQPSFSIDVPASTRLKHAHSPCLRHVEHLDNYFICKSEENRPISSVAHTSTMPTRPRRIVVSDSSSPLSDVLPLPPPKPVETNEDANVDQEQQRPRKKLKKPVNNFSAVRIPHRIYHFVAHVIRLSSVPLSFRNDNIRCANNVPYVFGQTRPRSFKNAT